MIGDMQKWTPNVASIMATTLGKDETWIKDQVESFNALDKQYLLV